MKLSIIFDKGEKSRAFQLYSRRHSLKAPVAAEAWKSETQEVRDLWERMAEKEHDTLPKS